MDGEQTPQTAAAAQTAQPAAAAAASHGAVPGSSRQQFAEIPELGPGKENDSGWVTYLQQLLNFFYQMQVVPQNGQFDATTRNAVSHFRQHIGQPAGEEVDLRVWQELGAESPSGSNSSGGQVSERNHQVQLVDLPGEAGWAAAMAIVLNAKGGSYTAESLCERAGANTSDRKDWQDARSVATNTLGMRVINCHGGTAAGWSDALQDSPLCMPNPNDQHNVVVVAGVSADGAHLHVLDPSDNFDVWMTFTEFTQYFGINDGYNAELLGA